LEIHQALPLWPVSLILHISHQRNYGDCTAQSQSAPSGCVSRIVRHELNEAASFMIRLIKRCVDWKPSLGWPVVSSI
jgi:hypothetical protein